MNLITSPFARVVKLPLNNCFTGQIDASSEVVTLPWNYTMLLLNSRGGCGKMNATEAYKKGTTRYLPYLNSAQNPVIFLVATVIKSVRRPSLSCGREKNNTSQPTAQPSDIFLTRLFGVSFSKFQNINLAKNLGTTTPLFQSGCFGTCRQASRNWRVPSSLDFLPEKFLPFLRPENTTLILNYEVSVLLVKRLFSLEQFPIECHKTKTKVITLANRNRCKQHNEPIRIRSKYM